MQNCTHNIPECSFVYLLAKAYYSARFQTTPLFQYSNVSFKRPENTRPLSFFIIPQTAENQGFLESKQTVSIFAWTLILYCIAKVCNRFSKWGKKFPSSSLDYLLFFASASKTAFVNICKIRHKFITQLKFGNHTIHMQIMI